MRCTLFSDLNAAFDGIEDRSTLKVAPWDTHTNAIGLRLLADKLFAELVPHLTRGADRIESERDASE